jgi:DNA-directed RNA polymerase specialized sigma24 family protein
MTDRGREDAYEARPTDGQQRRSPQERLPGHADPPESCSPVYRDPVAFASFYPRLDDQLRRALERRGLDPDTARDVSQEAWARLFKHSPPLADQRAVARWVSLVGYRLAEEWQATSSRAACGPVPDRELSDVADEVVARLDFRGVATAFNQLAPADRDVLLAAAEDVPRGATKRERDSVALRVHRARRRLRAP